MQKSEVWLNEGENDGRCFEVEYDVSVDEAPMDYVFPVVEIRAVREGGAQLSPTQLDSVREEILDVLYDELNETADYLF